MKRLLSIILAAGLLLSLCCCGGEEETVTLPAMEQAVEDYTENLNEYAAAQIEAAMTEDTSSMELSEDTASAIAAIDENAGTSFSYHLRERAELLGIEQPDTITEEAAQALCEGATDFSDLMDAFIEQFGLPDTAMNYDKVYFEYWLSDDGLESIILHESFGRVYRWHEDGTYEIWVDDLDE